MNMRLDKAGHGHSPLRIEREGGRRGRGTLADAYKLTAGDAEIAEAFGAPQRNIFDENI
jgi:hypothetical protein